MSSFENMKKNSESSLERLQRSLESANANVYGDGEDKYWKPELDKAGNGYAIIRFLPISPQDEDILAPWVKYYDHGFKGVGGWYIEKSLTTIGKPDPCGERNTELWNSGIEANKEIARKQKRRLHYVSNILVIKDPKNPENEGKVFLYRYGKKIMEKITTAMNPQFEDDTPIDPFNLWTGANFKLKIRKVDGYQNYDLSEFDSSSPLDGDDSVIKKIWESQYSLQSILDPKNFKSYDDLKTRLDRVLGVTSQNTVSVGSSGSNSPKVEEDVFASSILDENDSDLDYFSALLNEN